MSHNTRSQTSRTTSEVGEDMSQAEIEILQQRQNEKEKLLRAQAEALQKRQHDLILKEAELRKSKNTIDVINSQELAGILEGIQTNLEKLNSLSSLPDDMRNLNSRLNELSLRVDPEFISAKPLTNPLPTLNETYVTRPQSLISITETADEPPAMRLKDVIDSIPRYDGHKIPVYQFCKICDRALKLISPHQEYHLVQLIINKLQGNALTAVDGVDFRHIASLTRHLRAIFGPNKSLNQYRGELGNLYMKPNEDIFAYVDRAKELRSAIIDGETLLYGGDDVNIQIIDADCRESFINGLPSDLLVRVRLQGTLYNLDEAITSAIQLHKTLEAESIRKKPTNVIKSYSTPRVDYPSPTNTPRHQILQNPIRSFIKPLIPGQPGPNTPVGKVCRYCKDPGHLIEECQKLAYRNSVLTNRNTQINAASQPFFGSSNQGQPPKNSGNTTGVPANPGAQPNAEAIRHHSPTRSVHFQDQTPPLLPQG